MLNKLMTPSFYRSVLKNLEPEEIIPYEDYEVFIRSLISREYQWPPANRMEIRKIFSQKRRIVFRYPKTEMFFLRALNHYLFKFYGKNLSKAYFPSQGRNPSQCLGFILGQLKNYAVMHHKGIHTLYGAHLDISDYFNSIHPDVLFNRLSEDLQRDDSFKYIFEQILKHPYCAEHDGSLVPKKGGLAGLPLSAYCAAAYLSEQDRYFEANGIPYVRYSDDILFFAEDEATLTKSESFVNQFMTESGLMLNPDKAEKIKPGQPWTFIGFEVDGNSIDMASHAEEKIKRRVTRWAKRLRKRVELGYGRPIRKSSPEKAAASLIRTTNRALFKPIKDKYCWARWVFPTINTTKRLEVLDVFIQEKIRYVYTGRYSKANYRILPYDKLVGMGYQSLVKLYMLHQYRPEDYLVFLEGFTAEAQPKA